MTFLDKTSHTDWLPWTKHAMVAQIALGCSVQSGQIGRWQKWHGMLCTEWPNWHGMLWIGWQKWHGMFCTEWPNWHGMLWLGWQKWHGMFYPGWQNGMGCNVQGGRSV